MPHRCLSDANFDLVLAGESVFKRTTTVTEGPPDQRIAVNATIETDNPLGGNKRTVTLTWNGTVQQARNGAQVIVEKDR